MAYSPGAIVCSLGKPCRVIYALDVIEMGLNPVYVRRRDGSVMPVPYDVSGDTIPHEVPENCELPEAS